jgi:methylated-DNA-protein-cysteine methyltransferase-like protein
VALSKTELIALYQDIYRAVRSIPRGRVATYGQIAELAGLPGGGRTVGRAMKLATPALGLPWHRVVGRKTRASARVSILDPIGGSVQRLLLEKEGVSFSDSGAISLSVHGWLPSDASAPRPGRTRPKMKRRDPKAAPTR